MNIIILPFIVQFPHFHYGKPQRKLKAKKH